MCAYSEAAKEDLLICGATEEHDKSGYTSAKQQRDLRLAY